MRAVVTQPGRSPGLAIEAVPGPAPGTHQALVRVTAFSLNAGETRSALGASTRYTPGWDFAGRIEQAAADGSTPRAGTRVLGFVTAGAWAECVCARAVDMALIPEGLEDAVAASLPVAGVTALMALERAAPLLGKRVLVTGAAGGVGRFACQVAALSGAEVFAVSRRPELPVRLAQDGVASARVFADMAAAQAAGEYDVILDSVGGESLARALGALAPGGTCINCGNSSDGLTVFDVRPFYMKADTSLHGFFLRPHRAAGRCALPLARLATLAASGRLRTRWPRTGPGRRSPRPPRR